MSVIPCPLCGYDAPSADCPHCGGRAADASLERRSAGFLGALRDGLLAVPQGLLLLARTRGVKRWTVPPLLLTSLVFVGVLWWLYTQVGWALDQLVPEDVDLGGGEWEWLTGMSEGWDWLKAAVAAVVAALQWVLDHLLGLISGSLARAIVWLLVGLLISWYLFSMAYEALAGPFLDEIHGRIETRWFGHDPRNRIQRPTDIPVSRCVQLSSVAGVAAGLLLFVGLLSPVPFWLALLLSPLPFGLVSRRDREYGKWLAWVAKIEGRALWVSVKASIVTGILIVLALPLYFLFPPVGPLMFAGVVGFATAVSLLDIAFERRAWSLRDRLRFVGRNVHAMVAFGAVAGFLLTIPFIGWALMVPASSVGGLWLLCRLDKQALRENRRVEKRA